MTGELDRAGGDEIVITLKGGRDFDAPWVVIHGSNPERVWQLLQEVGPIEGANDMSIGQLAIAQAREFQAAWSSSPSTGTSRPAGNGSSRPASSNTSAASSRTSNRGGSSGAGKPMRSDQWPHGVGPGDFDPCPKHGDLIFKDSFEKNGKTVSARVSCPTPFCNAAPTYWERDGNFEVNSR